MNLRYLYTGFLNILHRYSLTMPPKSKNSRFVKSFAIAMAIAGGAVYLLPVFLVAAIGGATIL
jgi:hypothetical protein